MDNGKTDASMNLLAIECSQPQASLCLSQHGVITSETSWCAERNHDAHLFPALEKALAELGNNPLDYILVGAGPGSYGGVRVALAAAVGIATVRNARVVAVDSWAQLATPGAAVISDARRGGWTMRRPDGTIEVLTPAELAAEAEAGTPLYTIESKESMLRAGIQAEKYNLTPTAVGLVYTWQELSEERRNELANRPAEPIYVRPPHITEAKHKPWEIQ